MANGPPSRSGADPSRGPCRATPAVLQSVGACCPSNKVARLAAGVALIHMHKAVYVQPRPKAQCE
eukprot:1424209-Alexandrium_andersonii.AAC.1